MSIADSTQEARHHSYLPGTSHPLLPPEFLDPTAKSKKRQRPSSSSHHHGLITLPILVLPGVVLFPGASLPLRLHEPNWIEYLGNKIDESRRNGSPEEISIGVLPMATTNVNSGARRRRGMNANFGTGRRRGTWMRSGIHQTRDARDTELLNMINLLEGDDSMTEQSSSSSSSDEEIINANNIHSEEYDDEEEAATSHRRQQQGNGEQPQDPLLGRIGCIVTITNTHGDSSFEEITGLQLDQDQRRSRTDGSIWQNSHERSQLVVTAVGTGRFRVIESSVDNKGMHSSFTGFQNLRGGHGGMSQIQFYFVQELVEEEFLLPTMLPQQQQSNVGKTSKNVSLDSNDSVSKDYNHRHDTLLRRLSVVSPYPKFVWHRFWPWRLVTDIECSLVQIASLREISLHCEDQKKKSPAAFCFWLADNMPMSQEEKISLLQMDCVMERLWFFQAKLDQLKKDRTFLSCQACHSPLSSTGNAFTVGGAEGTTGNYVNEYGVIHQTITVRAIEEHSLQYSGGPETHDSWFPGYSWTIAHCSWCLSHIGWKFIEVDGNEESFNDSSSHIENDRPNVFWGLSGGAVITTKQVRVRRV